MHKVGDTVSYELEHKLRAGEKYSGKGKVIGTYRVYVILDNAEADKQTPYTSSVHESYVTPNRPALSTDSED